MDWNIWRLCALLLPCITLIQKCMSHSALLTIIDDKCITDTSSAMAILYNTTLIEKDFQTEVSQIRYRNKRGGGIQGMCVETEECLAGTTWRSVNSLEQRNVDNLITDRRWEVFRTFVTKPPLKVGDALDYQHAASFSYRANDLKISFSVQAEMEAHVFLCDGPIVSSSNCYWFLLQAWIGQESGFRQCKAYDIQSSHDGKEPKGICQISTRRWGHNRTIPQFLSADLWKNFRIVKRGTTYELQDQNGLVLYGTGTQHSRILPTNLFFHTKTGTGLWKVHNFNYFYTETAGDDLKSKRPFTVSKGENCLTMFVVMCEFCSMKIDLHISEEGQETIFFESTPIRTQDQRWNEVKYTFKMKESHNNAYIRIATSTTSPDQSNQKNYWAVNDVRSCEVDEIRVVKPTNQKAWTQRCQLVRNGIMVNIKRTKKISSLERKCTESQFGENCLDCELIYDGTCPKKNKYCQLLDRKSGYKHNCYCSIGYRGANCEENCSSTTYGHGCRNSCRGCRDSCSNDQIFGKCDSEYCSNNYLGEKCDIPSGIFLFDDLPEIEVGATSCNLRVKSFNGTGNPNVQEKFYKFQYAKVNENEIKKWKDVTDQPLIFGVSKKVTIQNLEENSVYSARVFGFDTHKDLDLLPLVSDKIKTRLFRPQRNESCQTPFEINGNCVPLIDCQSMVQLLSVLKKPYLPAVNRTLLDYRCGDPSEHKVCCPPGTIVLDPQDLYHNREVPPDVSNHRHIDLLPTDCGNLPDSSRISGGTNVSMNEFPWMALLQYKTSNGLKFICGGTIINWNYILTAAHCVNLPDTELLSVRVGEYSIKNLTDCEVQNDRNRTIECNPPVQDLRIEKIIVHPQVISKKINIFNDIALLRVSRITKAVNAVPVCLPVEKIRDRPNVIVVGWGLTNSLLEIKADILQMVSLPVTNKSTCKATYRKSLVELAKTQICAGGSDGKGSCSGDSGGPALVTGFLYGDVVYVQQGIVSVGPRYCETEGLPGVYTSVSYYMDWILDNMEL